MAHCLLWYKQFKKDPGFCGLSRKAQKQTGAYLDFVMELESMGLPEDQILLFLSASAYNNSGLRSLIPSSSIRKDTVSKIFDAISNNKKITQHMARTFTGIDNWDEKIIEKNVFLSDATNTNGRAGLSAATRKQTLLSAINRRKANPSSTYVGRKCPSVADRISKLYQINTQGQTNILMEMNTAGYGEDIYGAYCIALKWASERLESEKAKV
jgi:hypothetical protein